MLSLPSHPLSQLINIYIYYFIIEQSECPCQLFMFASGKLFKIRISKADQQIHNQPSLMYYESESSDCEQFQNEQRVTYEPMNSLVGEFRHQLAIEEEMLEIRKNRRLLSPTDEELEEAIEHLRDYFPEQDTYLLVKRLYQNLIPQNLLNCKKRIPNTKVISEEEVKEVLYINSPFAKFERNINSIETIQKYIGFKKVCLRSAWSPPIFHSDNLDKRFTLKKCVARSFAFRGHSLNHFRRELEETQPHIKLEKTMYNPILQAVTIEAYKFLEQFLINDCRLKIEILVRNQLKYITKRLYHCRQNLKKGDSSVFLDVVKANYGLEDVILEEYSMIKLYLATQRGLLSIMLNKFHEEEPLRDEHYAKFMKKKQAEAKANTEKCDDTKSIIYQKTLKNKGSIELQNFWTIKLENQFIQVYKKVQHFMDIKRYFAKKYPQYKHFFKGNGLKNRLNQILRASMRRVRNIIAQNSQIAFDLVKMDDNAIKYIMKSSRAMKARLMLVDIYLDDNKAYNSRIEAVAKELNQAIADKPYYKSFSSCSGETSQPVQSKFSSVQDCPSRVYAPIRANDYKQVRLKKQRGRQSSLMRRMYQDDQKKFIQYQKPKEVSPIVNQSSEEEQESETLVKPSAEDQLIILEHQSVGFDKQFYKGQL